MIKDIIEKSKDIDWEYYDEKFCGKIRRYIKLNKNIKHNRVLKLNTHNLSI